MKYILIICFPFVLQSCNTDKNKECKFGKAGIESMSSVSESGVSEKKFDIVYDASGDVRSITNYASDGNSVIVNYYDSSHYVKDITQIQQSKKNGVAYSFYPSGYLNKIKHYADDTLSGRFTEFHDRIDLIKRVVPEIQNGNYTSYFEYNLDKLGLMDKGIKQFNSDTILKAY